MPIIKECNLEKLQDLYGTGLGRLDSRVTGRNVLSESTPGISPSYGEWLEFVIKITKEELVNIQRHVVAKREKEVAYQKSILDCQTAYDEYQAGEYGEDAGALEDAFLEAQAEMNRLQEELSNLLLHDRECIFRFANPSPIEIFQVYPIFDLAEKIGIKGRLSNLPMEKMLFTVLNERRADGWYDCRILCMLDDDSVLEDLIKGQVSVFFRFWRLYN